MSDLQALLRVPTRGDIDRLQAEMLKFPQVGNKTNHRFADGMYLREYTQFADTLAVSKIHKRENFLIVTKGRAWIAEEGAMVEVKGGDIIVTKPGTKRAVLTKDEEVTIITVHRVGKERDLGKIERRLTHFEKAAAFDVRNNPKPGVLMAQEAIQ